MGLYVLFGGKSDNRKLNISYCHSIITSYCHFLIVVYQPTKS